MPISSSPEHPVPLREIAAAVKGWVDRLGALWVSAQVIEINRRTSATQFLTLRDPTEEVSVSVTLSTAVLDAAGPVSEGMAVTALLKPAVWMKTGRLSYECFDLRPTGEGRLLAQIEHRKRLLQAEGLFNPALKRRLPALPRGIGLITGKDSAAERDVVVNVGLRWPVARIVTRHCLMQGPSSAAQVMEAVAAFDADPGIDVIVIARGGGSVEDLLGFSDEALVRAVARARTPIVSAIGHEADTPILDLVADLRASTPTDAAKRIVPDAREELEKVARVRARMTAAVSGWVNTQSDWLAQLRQRPVLRAPASRFEVYAEQIRDLERRLVRAATAVVDKQASQVAQARALVRSLGPQSVLNRGYAILTTEDGVTVASIADAAVGADLAARVSDGTLTVKVTDKEKGYHGNNTQQTG